MNHRPRRLASIMFSDMVGYSAMAQRDEGIAIELLNEHRMILREIFVRFGGREMDAVGDGFFVEFSSAVEAARCAAAIQDALCRRNTSVDETRKIQVRIGIHLGDVVVDDGRIVGDGVNVAARVQPFAQAGEVCISEDVARQVRNKVEFELEDMGSKSLKNITAPVRIFRMRLPGQAPLRAAGTRRTRRRLGWWTGALLLMMTATGVGYWQNWLRKPVPMGSTSQPRLAVMPFENLSPDPRNEYFADGMTEELISRLSRINGIDVIARTSVMQYKGQSKTVAQIGTELGVATILAGSVRRSEGKLRISAQLIDAKKQNHLWSEDYDRMEGDVFAIQAEVAQRVAAALVNRVAPGDQKALERGGTRSLEAYDLYIQGLHHQNKQSKEGLSKSLEYFARALAVDKDYARAHVAMAITYELQGEFYYEPASSVFPLARDAASQALRIDSDSVDAVLVLAAMSTYLDLDWEGTYQLYQRALSLNTGSANAHDWYGILYLAPRGQFDKAVEHLKRAVDLDPLSTLFLFDLGATFHVKRDYVSAVTYYSRALDREPSAGWVRLNRGWALASLGRHKEAIEDMRTLSEQERSAHNLSGLAWAYGVAGHEESARQVMRELQDRRRYPDVPPVSLAWALIGIGEYDRAVELLEQAYQQKEYRHLLFIGTSPVYDPLRSHPRFQDLLVRMKLPQLKTG